MPGPSSSTVTTAVLTLRSTVSDARVRACGTAFVTRLESARDQFASRFDDWRIVGKLYVQHERRCALHVGPDGGNDFVDVSAFGRAEHAGVGAGEQQQVVDHRPEPLAGTAVRAGRACRPTRRSTTRGA